MFGLLKNKLSSFISSLTGREQKKAEEESRRADIFSSAPESEQKLAQAAEKEKLIAKPEEAKPQQKEKIEAKSEVKNIEPKKSETPEIKAEISKAAPKKEENAPEAKAEPKTEAKAEMKKLEQAAEPAPAVQIPIEAKPSAQKPAEKTEPIPIEPKQKGIELRVPRPPEPEKKKGIFESLTGVFSKKEEKKFEPSLERLSKASASERRIEAKPGIISQLKSAFSSTVEISEGDVADLLDGLELSLLESDVAYEVSVSLAQDLRKKLVGKRIEKGKLQEEVQSTVRSVLVDAMTSQKAFVLAKRLATFEKPAKILFIGPNGAGKTTTMAKLAHQLMGGGLRVVFSASDTFRAAAIEQTEEHAGRLGIKVIKGKYGQDPASVGFEAISYAKAHGVDVVMIDSAGRQDTNQNLLDELKKIVRVCKPDLKIYIGESIGGNAVIEQIRAFDLAAGLDGVILTKLDCDAKGGTAISVTRATGIPVLFVGTGQRYEDLIPFSPSGIAEDILSEGQKPSHGLANT
jgi:fused signal recognition particle receptor